LERGGRGGQEGNLKGESNLEKRGGSKAKRWGKRGEGPKETKRIKKENKTTKEQHPKNRGLLEGTILHLGVWESGEKRKNQKGKGTRARRNGMGQAHEKENLRGGLSTGLLCEAKKGGKKGGKKLGGGEGKKTTI